jgi:hypothetical protein
METSMAPAARSAVCALADGLAIEHGSRNLRIALYGRLDADGCTRLSEQLEVWRPHPDLVRLIHTGPRAMTLVAHLHMMGRGELAEALPRLLHGPEFVPKVSVTTAISQKWLDWFDAHTSPILDQEILGRGLVRRLRYDASWYERNPGHMDAVAVADQIEAVLGLTSKPLVLEPRPFPAVGLAEEAAEAARAERLTAERLATEHTADVLGRALVVRLHAEGNHGFADLIWNTWIGHLQQARVDAGKSAITLIAGLRERGRGDLADRATALLRGLSFPPAASAHLSLPATLTPEALAWLGVYAAPDLHPRAASLDLNAWLTHHGHEDLLRELFKLLKPVVAPTLEDLRRSKDPYFDWLREQLEKMEADKKPPPAT